MKTYEEIRMEQIKAMAVEHLGAAWVASFSNQQIRNIIINSWSLGYLKGREDLRAEMKLR
jgi:hypothetical protein